MNTTEKTQLSIAEHLQTIADKVNPTPYVAECDEIPETERCDDEKWRARWTMPGYLDCGEWFTGETETEALKYLLESNSADNFADDWEIQICERLIDIVNGVDDKTEDEKTEALEVVLWNLPTVENRFEPHSITGGNVYYSGDSSPLAHGGYFYNLENWKPHGYANTIKVSTYGCELEGYVTDIERGTISAGNDTDAEIAETYGIKIEDITDNHRVEYAESVNGIEVSEDFGGAYCETFRNLPNDDWFADSEGNVVNSSAVELKIAEYVKQWTK